MQALYSHISISINLTCSCNMPSGAALIKRLCMSTDRFFFKKFVIGLLLFSSIYITPKSGSARHKIKIKS